MIMQTVKCIFCGQKVVAVNDHATCKSCWCPEGEIQWKEDKNTFAEMLQDRRRGIETIY